MSQDEEDLHELNIRAPVENEVEPPRRSDVTTESVYSSSGNNHSPPASPKTAAAPDSRVLRPLETTTLPLKSPQQQPTTSTPSPQTQTQTPTYLPRDLQRQQEVRDRLSGKSGAKAGALIEMYRKRERQATGGISAAAGVGGGSPGKISSSALKSTQAQAQAAKESTALPTPPDEAQSNGPELETEPSVVDVVQDVELMEPPSLDLDSQGRSSSPYRYVHGAPLHNVVEEEEEE